MAGDPTENSILPFRPNVCMLVFNGEKRIFLGERLGSPGVWQLPQGGVEEGETLEVNVLRELNEELGVAAEHLSIVKMLKATNEYVWDHPPEYARGIFRGQSQSFWLVRFSGSDDDIHLGLHEHPEFANFRWCSPDEVRQLAEPRRQAGYAAALAEFEKEVLAL